MLNSGFVFCFHSYYKPVNSKHLLTGTQVSCSSSASVCGLSVEQAGCEKTITTVTGFKANKMTSGASNCCVVIQAIPTTLGNGDKVTTDAITAGDIRVISNVDNAPKCISNGDDHVANVNIIPTTSSDCDSRIISDEGNKAGCISGEKHVSSGKDSSTLTFTVNNVIVNTATSTACNKDNAATCEAVGTANAEIESTSAVIDNELGARCTQNSDKRFLESCVAVASMVNDQLNCDAENMTSWKSRKPSTAVSKSGNKCDDILILYGLQKVLNYYIFMTQVS